MTCRKCSKPANPSASPPASFSPKARCGIRTAIGISSIFARNQLLRLTPGKEPERVRPTIGGNGTTFDLQGRLIVCEGDDRRLTRMGPDSKVETLVDNYQGGRFNRPNDVICHSNGCLYFTDPDKRRPYHEREIPGPSGEDNLWGRRSRLSPGAGRRFERAGKLRIPERARAVAGRAHDGTSRTRPPR